MNFFKKRHAIFALILCSGLNAVAQTKAGPAPSKELEALLQHSIDERTAKQGRQYQDKFLAVIEPVMGKALQVCTSKTPDTVEPGFIVFVIGANGRVKRLMWSAKIPMAECVGENFRSITTLPRPPHDDWVDGVLVANHSQAQKKGPVDKPIKAPLAELDKAIAPYVAKARATYPAAKRRFLAGLPPGYTFSVRVRLRDRNGQVEDSFLTVKKISGDEITGVLGAVDFVHSYKRGQTITVKESDIDNWVIDRPDGSEEGNYVGKFLDHYKPK